MVYKINPNIAKFIKDKLIVGTDQEIIIKQDGSVEFNNVDEETIRDLVKKQILVVGEEPEEIRRSKKKEQQ